MSSTFTDCAGGDSADSKAEAKGDSGATPPPQPQPLGALPGPTPSTSPGEGWTATWKAPGDSVEPKVEWCGIQVGTDDQGNPVRPEAFVSVSAADFAAALLPERGDQPTTSPVENVIRAKVAEQADKYKDSSGVRAEGVGPTEHVTPDPTNPIPVRYEWATYFPATYPENVPGEGIYEVFLQWHQQDTDGAGSSPPLGFMVYGQDLCLALHRLNPNNPGESVKAEGPPPIVVAGGPGIGFRGKWHYFRAEVVWDLTLGSVKVWHSLDGFAFAGEATVTVEPFQTMFPTRSTAEPPAVPEPGTCYLKAGLYRDDTRHHEGFVVYHDEVVRYAKPDDGVKCAAE